MTQVLRISIRIMLGSPLRRVGVMTVGLRDPSKWLEGIEKSDRSIRGRC